VLVVTSRLKRQLTTLNTRTTIFLRNTVRTGRSSTFSVTSLKLMKKQFVHTQWLTTLKSTVSSCLTFVSQLRRRTTQTYHRASCLRTSGL
ncbi:ubiquinone oxidoreductase, Na(+)-translocating, F subunit, partial [Vibrio parahaemolyticus V-223/04]